MKPIHIGFLMAMLMMCIVGIASAAGDPVSADQDIIGTVPAYTLTITAPVDIPSWDLERGVDNQRYIGSVVVSTTAPNGYIMDLKVAGDQVSMYSGSVLLGTNMMVSVDPPEACNTWNSLTTGGLILFTQPASITPVSIPISLKQFVSTNDPAGDYTIKIMYTLSVTAPASTP